METKVSATEFPLSETLIPYFLLEGKTMIFVLSRFIDNRFAMICPHTFYA